MEYFLVVCLALVMAAMGIWAAVDPEGVIYMGEFWRYDSFSPSEHYIRRTRALGILTVIAAVCLVIYVFTQ